MNILLYFSGSKSKKDGLSRLKITDATSLNTDNVESDDSDESPLAHKRTKAGKASFVTSNPFTARRNSVKIFLEKSLEVFFKPQAPEG